jgi:2-polyprenyl-6-methoxyphenol hydroxylase-like FAD-dependent oxidoreductase
MDTWSKGRVVLVGDAGYSVSLTLGQSTSVAMVGAYVLTGELAIHKENLNTAFANYENELREYVESNQDLAFKSGTEPQQTTGKPSEDGTVIETTNLPDFGQSIIPIALKDYI